MKNRILLLLALVVTLALGAPVARADGFKIMNQPALTWYKAITSAARVDSTSVGIGFVDGDGVTNADTTTWTDTALWPPLYGVSNGTTTATSLIALQVNAQQAATADSMRITVQWSNDGSNTSSTNMHANSAVVLVTNRAPITTILDSDDTAYGRFFRVIFENHDGSTKVARRVSIVPVVKVAL